MTEPYLDAEAHFVREQKAAEREFPRCQACGDPIFDNECVIIDSFDVLGSIYHRDCAVEMFVTRTPRLF